MTEKAESIPSKEEILLTETRGLPPNSVKSDRLLGQRLAIGKQGIGSENEQRPAPPGER